jgi:hypothetical protein
MKGLTDIVHCSVFQQGAVFGLSAPERTPKKP